ncbi:MAG: hypothetical protein CPDRYMAC_5323 [uncultured Paraburkholderia sp.]|nr:MAG: hypothetical protein CPDRYDRY_5232 [uncultured Paraburkholderia sp.]CAH2940498.1 MAG: hypothetical protein CPDRYMAC_5323 [uncultured Paraburkholderia sp.]
MTSDLHRQYPRQRLLFFVAQDVDDEIVGAVKQMIRELSAEKNWVLAPPAFIDHVDDTRTDESDVSDRTVGGTLDMLGTNGNTLPRDLDAATFADVDRVVQAVQALSAKWSLEVEFELNGAYVGAIDEGTLDRSLAEGLLGEWRRHLDIA